VAGSMPVAMAPKPRAIAFCPLGERTGLYLSRNFGEHRLIR